MIRKAEWTKKKIPPLYLGVAILSFIIIIVGVILWISSTHYEKTDNAYVGGNQIVVNPQISGTIVQIHTDDTRFVNQGDLLVSLDCTDQNIQLETKKEELANACRTVVDLFEQEKQKRALVESKKAACANSEREYRHRQELFPDGAVSLEDLEKAQTQYEMDFARLDLAVHEWSAAAAKVANTTPLTHPQVLQSIESLNKAYIDRQRCQIFAPTSGVIAQRKAQVGSWITPETTLMNIIPLDQMWVDANYLEKQLRNIRIGQSVQLHSDLYGSDIVFDGQVIGIGMGTGSVFSVLPPQNATGNWIKIVQRVPVRIALNGCQLKTYPLRLGLSMVAKTWIKNRVGETVPTKNTKVCYATDIYASQEVGFKELVDLILEDNIPGSYR